MHNRILILFATLISALQTFGDYSIDWMKTPPVAYTGTSIATDNSDNVYSTSSEGSIHLQKHDKFGNFKWQVTSSTTLQFNYEFPVKVFIDPQNNPVVVGYRYTYSSSNGINANAIIILKYDPAGNLIHKEMVSGTFSYFNNSRFWTNVSAEMDITGYLYIGSAGNINGQFGFNVIKFSPAGSVVRISTEDVNPGSPFYFVSRLRLSGNLIGLTGTTTHSSANVTSWVLDTAGNTRWTDVATGIQGNDIFFDSAKNVYVLTSVSVSSFSDAVIYKYDSAGAQLWNHNYDFGGSELSSRMESSNDGNIAVMMVGNQAPSGSNYVDWITLKIDTAGNMLWYDRYNEHGGNDEHPGMMAVDKSGNIFVTGIGGPFPGGSTLSARQMVTVKYTPSGARDWVSVLDTINESLIGIGISIGTDSSIFVLGDLNTFIVHYYDHTGTAPCSAPQNITSSVISGDSVTIDWSPVANAFLYHIQYKPSTSQVWQLISTDTTSFTLAPLYPGTTYDFNVEAICNSGPTGYSAVQQFTTSGTGYCQSYGTDASHEWIDLVFIETLLNNTPDSDSGYADYTYLSVDLIAGNSYDITLSAGMIPAANTENWKVWIDFNRNGDFSDPGEEVVYYSSSQIGWETHNFTVPANAVPGHSRMRVSMKNGNPAQTPCEIFSIGEVEDYTVNIGVATNIIITNVDKMVTIFPNPVTEYITIQMELNGEKEIQITDLAGHVLSQTFTNNDILVLPVNHLAKGIYLLRVMDSESSVITNKFIK